LPSGVFSSADLEIRDTADLEVGAAVRCEHQPGVGHFVIESAAAMCSLLGAMKLLPLLSILLISAVAAPAQFTPATPAKPPALPVKPLCNYLLQVEWKSKTETNAVKVLTTEGQFNLDALQGAKVKINNNDIPVTLRLSGTLTVLSPDTKGQLTLFLGRTVPYVTGASSGPGGMASSYQQMQVGLNSTYIVTFGKPLLIQSDGNEEVTILVSRQED
jgi:hypothetical protein